MSAPIEVRELRAGTPRVLLLHGLEDSWASWRPLAAHLPSAWGLVALDLPWRAGNDYAWRRAAHPSGWLRAGLDLLGGPVDATIAHSFGATAALALMTAGERRLGTAAVLISPLYRRPDRPVTWDMLDRSRTTFVQNVRDGVAARLGGRVTDPDVREGVLAKAVDRVGPRGLLVTFDEFVASADLPLYAVTQDTLILAGGDDPVLSRTSAASLAERVPGARLRIGDGLDHHCHLRRPAPVAGLAEEFVRTHMCAPRDGTRRRRERQVTATSRHQPRYEGANIRTWIGFKHFMYIVEEAVLDWFRAHTPGARRLYHEHGLGLEIVDCSVQLPSVLEVDDEVRAEVEPRGPGRFDVRLYAGRPVLRGKVTVALVREADPPDQRPYDGEPRPSDLGDGEPVDALPGGFRWDWRAPYFYCHFSDRVQHSGYVRALEDVVDRFLADRGISVGRMLAERGWIPVVSRARVRLLGAAHMEETVHTTFTVEEILRGTMFDGRMDCYVRRGDGFARVATASILHGYAISRGPSAGGLAELDDVVVKALTGGDAG